MEDFGSTLGVKKLRPEMSTTAQSKLSNTQEYKLARKLSPVLAILLSQCFKLSKGRNFGWILLMKTFIEKLAYYHYHDL